MKRYPIILILLLPFTLLANFQDVQLGGGSLTELVKEAQVDEQGGTDSYTFTPFFNAVLKRRVYKKLHVFPEFGISFPKSGRDENIKKTHYNLLASLGYDMGDFTFRLGAGFFWTRITSEGGTVQLQNGSASNYTEFPLPEYSRTTQMVVYTTDLEYFFYKREYSARVMLQFMNPGDEFKQAYNYLILLQYHFGAMKWNFWET